MAGAKFGGPGCHGPVSQPGTQMIPARGTRGRGTEFEPGPESNSGMHAGQQVLPTPQIIVACGRGD
eukprot:763521-Hanusia_phi.AAC.1